MIVRVFVYSYACLVVNKHAHKFRHTNSKLIQHTNLTATVQPLTSASAVDSNTIFQLAPPTHTTTHIVQFGSHTHVTRHFYFSRCQLIDPICVRESPHRHVTFTFYKNEFILLGSFQIPQISFSGHPMFF